MIWIYWDLSSQDTWRFNLSGFGSEDIHSRTHELLTAHGPLIIFKETWRNHAKPTIGFCRTSVIPTEHKPD